MSTGFCPLNSMQNNPTKWGLGFEADSDTLRGAPKFINSIVSKKGLSKRSFAQPLNIRKRAAPATIT